jgi:hypothetical protein
MKKTIGLLLGVFLLTGCFEIDQTIRLEKNLSGTADFHLGVNFEPMVTIMAQFAHDMEGKKGAVTAADIEKAKADFRKNAKKSSSEKPSLAEMRKSMPEGIELLDFKAKESDFRIDSDFKFGFKKLQNLVGVKLPSKEGADPTQKNVVDTPFDGLELVEKGDTITIRTKPVNPAEAVKEEAKDAPKMDAAAEKLMRDAFKDLRVTYRISAPFTVVSHNATRKEGNTLIWEYSMDRFEELSKKSADELGVRVTYRR